MMSAATGRGYHRASQVTAEATSPLSPSEVMPLLMNLPLPTMFVKWGVFPGVTGVEIIEGVTWDHVGARRKLAQTNNGSMLERITRYEPGKGFTYHSTAFNKAFEPVATEVDDNWDFERYGSGTRVLWTWTFHATHRYQWVVGIPMRPLWQTYMRQILVRNIAALSAD